MTLTDCICQEKKDEEESQAFKIIDAPIHCQEDYIKKRGGRLITATRNNSDNTSINRTAITRKLKWEEKHLYGYFKRQTSEISHEKTWTWLRKGNFRRETEFLLGLETTEWRRCSIGNCARNWNLNIRTNRICTTQNLSQKMRRTKFSGILRCKRII